MLLSHQIARLFGADIVCKSDETFRYAHWSFEGVSFKMPKAEDLQTALAGVSPRDTSTLNVSVDGCVPIVIKGSDTTEVTSFLENLGGYYRGDPNDSHVSVEIEFSKALVGDTLSIYDFSSLTKTIGGLNSKNLLAAFEFVLSSAAILFEVKCPDVVGFSTETLTVKKKRETTLPVNRLRLTDARNEYCHVQGIQKGFYPGDFRVLEPSSSEIFNQVLNRLCLIVSLAYLADLSSIENSGEFRFKINGYRVVSGVVASEEVSEALVAEIYKIFQWAYSNGGTADKLGLARNIISLHWKGESVVAPDDGLFDSILSGYDIYLKEHVDRYIKLKKSLCDYLSDFSQKSSKLAESIGDKLEKSFVAFVGFFISTILLKVVTAKDLGGLFPKPLQVIAWGLIAGSFVHALISLLFSINERKRVIEDFGLLRLRYSDLLSKADLDRTFNGDAGITRVTGHLDYKLKLLFGGWFLMLIVCGCVVWKLGREMDRGVALETRGTNAVGNASTSNSVGAVADPGTKAVP